MRTATTVEASGEPWDQTVEFVAEAERLGLDACWVAEAWGSDAPSPLGYLAARTERMLLGSGVVQVGTRSPALVAQTALTLQTLSRGRFLLGLGSSGPQVLEGLHGVPFAHPLGRMRETAAQRSSTRGTGDEAQRSSTRGTGDEARRSSTHSAGDGASGR